MEHHKWVAKAKARKKEISRKADVAAVKAVRERFLPPPRIDWAREMEILRREAQVRGTKWQGTVTGRFNNCNPKYQQLSIINLILDEERYHGQTKKSNPDNSEG